MKQSDTTPWYKQFWPWFLITIPVISMILSITMLNLALNTEDSLVIDDYYKEGRGINLELTKVKEAKVQGISTRITFNNKRVSLEFNTGAPQSAQALQLFFYHPTLQNKDFSLLLTQNANRAYTGVSKQDLTGKWTITLTPMDEKWKIVKDITLPREQGFEFNP